MVKWIIIMVLLLIPLVLGDDEQLFTLGFGDNETYIIALPGDLELNNYWISTSVVAPQNDGAIKFNQEKDTLIKRTFQKTSGLILWMVVIFVIFIYCLLMFMILKRKEKENEYNN